MVLPAIAAQMPLPELRVEPTTGGSIFIVKNVSPQPLTAFLIELVNYPGSSFAFLEDEITAEPVAPGAEKRIPSSNMTVGAVPDYVKLVAAVYADGSSSGVPEKVTEIVDFRRSTLETTRELIRRIEKAKTDGTSKATVAAGLKQWGDSMPEPARRARYSATGVRQTAVKVLIAETAARLDAQPLDDVLASLRTSEQAMAAGKPH